MASAGRLAVFEVLILLSHLLRDQLAANQTRLGVSFGCHLLSPGKGLALKTSTALVVQPVSDVARIKIFFFVDLL